MADISDEARARDAISTQSRGTILIQESVLKRFRKLLSQSWSRETAYPSDQSLWTPHNPSAGQCGVSSVWLAQVLYYEYSMRPTFCRGSLIFHYHTAEDLLDHCWLEINGESGDVQVLDLTGDQKGFGRPIILGPKMDLNLEHIHYFSHERVEFADLPNNPVWKRYELLLSNLRRLASASHTDQESIGQSYALGYETLRLARAL
jgi:hypothetical protein